jgi:hypothetical protein
MQNLIPADSDFSGIIKDPQHPKQYVPANPVFGVIRKYKGI